MAKKTTAQGTANIMNGYFPFVLILPLLLLPPFFRGLFFDSESLVAYMYTSVVIAFYVYYKKEYLRVTLNLMDIAFVGFVLAWFTAIIPSVDMREAVGDALRNLNYLLIYFFVAGMAANLQHLRAAMWTIYAAGIGVALAGIGTAFGTFSFNGAFVDGLINSTLQYHNAAAIYLMACAIVALYLAANAQDLRLRYAVSAGNFLILLTAFGAGSRGAMLMGPIAFTLYLVGVPGLRIKSVSSLIAISIPFALLSSRLLDFANLQLPWLLLLLGMLLTAVLYWGIDQAVSRLSVKIDIKKLWISVAAIFLIIGAVLFIFSEEIMPQSMSDRLHNFDLQQGSVQERFYFYQDSLKIIKENPLFGTGGGGWNALYRQYQGYLYHSTEVHNHFLQVWVETGTIGFVFYLLLWLGGLVSLIKIMRSAADTEHKAIVWTAASAALALGLHSLIDFSLSEGAVSILLWSQFAMIRAVQRMALLETKVIMEYKPLMRKILGIGVAAVFFMASMTLWIGDRYSIAASTALRSGNITEGMEQMEKAVQFDPINANFRIQLAQVYGYQAAQTQNYYLGNSAFNEAKKAVELNSANAEYFWMATQTAAGAGQAELMVGYAEKAVSLAPLVYSNYENLAMAYLNAGKMYINNKQMDKAREVLQKVGEIPERLEEIWHTKNDVEKKFWKGPPLEPTEKMNQLIQEAQGLLTQV